MLRLLVLTLGCCALLAAVDPTVAPPPPATAVTPTPAATTPAVTTPAVTTPPAPGAGSGQVRGTILYGRRTPAVGAIVIVRPDTSPSPVRIATAGTNGTFAFDGLPDGIYRAEVRRDGYVPIIKSGVKVRAPFRAVVELLLVPGEAPPEPAAATTGQAKLLGTVRVGGGAPLAEARIRLTRSDGADDSRTVLTDVAGTFTVPEMKAGRWRIDVQGAGLLPVRADLDLDGDVAVDVQLAAQPATYKPSPQDLIVPEEAIPPPGATPTS